MADAEEQGLTAEIESVELTLPVMPHLALSGKDLDELYPALVAPDEPDDPDYERECNDATLVSGFKIAGEISEKMVTLGRTRREGDVRGGNPVNYANGAYLKNVASEPNIIKNEANELNVAELSVAKNDLNVIIV